VNQVQVEKPRLGGVAPVATSWDNRAHQGGGAETVLKDPLQAYVCYSQVFLWSLDKVYIVCVTLSSIYITSSTIYMKQNIFSYREYAV